MYNVTIKYFGVAEDAGRVAASIARIFEPHSSYIDSPAFTIGYPQTGSQKYGPSVYATNRDGIGDTSVPEPYATTGMPFPVPMAQFKLATIGEEFTEDSKTGHKVVFAVEDYKEALYYKELAAKMADQGFVVEVAAA